MDADHIKETNDLQDKEKERQKKKKEDEKKALDDFNAEIADIKVAAIKDETKKAEAAENVRFEKQRSKLA